MIRSYGLVTESVRWQMVTFGSGVGEGVAVSQAGGVGVSVLLSNPCALESPLAAASQEFGRTVLNDQPLPAKT